MNFCLSNYQLLILKNVYLLSVNFDVQDCYYLSCTDDNCIKESKCSEENCYSFDQFCDGINDCPESGFDEMLCDISEAGRMAKFQKPKTKTRF